MTLHNQLNFLLTWNSSQQEQTLKSYTHPCFRWSWLPQRCTFSKLSWKVWVQMRVTQRIICCWRKVFSTQSGTAANCSSWSKGSLFTCLALKWGVVQAHMELSCPFRFRWVWVSPTRLLTGRGCYKQERLHTVSIFPKWCRKNWLPYCVVMQHFGNLCQISWQYYFTCSQQACPGSELDDF